MTPSRPPLVDTFGRRHNYLRISVTDRCNFRCAYCMPHEHMEWTPRAEILTFEEIERLASLFAAMGVDKVRLTGGEPTTRKDFVQLVEGLHRIEGIKKLLLTTNGAAMSGMAQQLRSAGISGVNISLDTLRADRFFEITGRNKLGQVLDGIDAAIESGFESLKINVVVMSGINQDEIPEFVDRFRNLPIEVRFIEFMPFLDNHWNASKLVPYKEIRRQIESRFTLMPIAGERSDVAKTFGVLGTSMRVGFITSMTDHFCGGCNRLRLTADGRLKVCLFAKTGPSLRDAMRAGASDNILEDTIRRALDAKWAGHPPMDRLIESNDLPMITIGG